MTVMWVKFMNLCYIIQLPMWDHRHSVQLWDNDVIIACHRLNTLWRPWSCSVVHSGDLFFSSARTERWNDLSIEMLKSVMGKCHSKWKHTAKVTRNITKLQPKRELQHHLSTFSRHGTWADKALVKAWMFIEGSMKMWKIIKDSLLKLSI